MNKRRFQLSRSVKTKFTRFPYLEMQRQGLGEGADFQVKGKHFRKFVSFLDFLT